MVEFFGYFWNNLYSITEISRAFKMICLDKMISDGYFDMSKYIFARIKKDDILTQLSKEKSPYGILYQNPYPHKESAYEFWNTHFNTDAQHGAQLTRTEAEAVVNWIYRICSNAQEREEFTIEFFHHERLCIIYRII